MTDQLIPLEIHKITQSKSFTTMILNAREKKFAIYMAPQIGKQLLTLLTDESNTRPQTHDLINLLFKGFEITILQVVIHHVEETIFFARLFLQQEQADKTHIIEIDTRPSDALLLALHYDAPLFCSPQVYEKSVPFVE